MTRWRRPNLTADEIAALDQISAIDWSVPQLFGPTPDPEAIGAVVRERLADWMKGHDVSGTEGTGAAKGKPKSKTRKKSK